MTVTIIETTTTDACTQAALAWVQEHGYTGDRLPKGVRGSSHLCPLSKATGLIVGADTAFRLYDHREDEFRLPLRVVEWRRRFDRGELPEFDLEAHDG